MDWITSNPPRKIDFTPSFKQALKRLRKKYRHADGDVQAFIQRLENGETPGDQIPGVGYPVYKERLQNTDLAKGKRSGYRVVYYLRTKDAIVLLLIYVKSEQTDVPMDVIAQLIAEYQAMLNSAEE